MGQKDEKISGYIGSNKYFHENEETQKTVISFTVNAGGRWERVRAFGETAKMLNNAIEKDGIKKVTLLGCFKEINYAGRDGAPKSAHELFVNTVVLHKPMEINGLIAKVQHEKTKNDKDMTKLFIIKDHDIGGQVEKLKYNAVVFSEVLKKLPDNVKLEVGHPVAIKGEASITTFRNSEDKIERGTQITAWNVARTPALLKEQIAALQESANKEPVKEASKVLTKAASKSKNEQGMSL